ncbi:MAG: Two-component response regulator [Parcubacteria group bacterium GW2011_GWA2_47_7]|nr:MAG: Two-component response regulator [Parcubacteria group bacterium GW2011_GWA2_47_7]
MDKILRYTNGHMETKKILSIEDDEFLSSLVSGKLIESGFSVITAGTGKDGLAKAELEHPNLILLDIMLPDMGGFEILQSLKANPATKDIPVIILSNLGGRDEIEKGVALGASSYLIKSNILPHEVAEMVQNQLASIPHTN